MNDGEFEWDDSKAENNWLKHGVRFESAKDVFDDDFAIEEIDESQRYNEDRFIIIGMVANRLIHVAYTFRNYRYRIISARFADTQESRLYYGKK
jgi:uncharacterized protein